MEFCCSYKNSDKFIKKGFWRFWIQILQKSILTKYTVMKILVLLKGYYFVGEEWKWILIVRDRREGEGEVKREEINYHSVHWEDQGLCAVLVCGTMLLPCLFVCMCQHWHQVYTQHILSAYRSERSEWPVMSNSRGNKDREMFIPISNSWQILC